MTDLTTRTWTLYQLRNTTTGHLYIGQTVQTLNDRWKRHCSLARAGHTSVLAAIKAWWATQPAEVRSQRAKQRRAGRKAQCASE